MSCTWAMPFSRTLLLALSTVCPLAAQVATGKAAPEITARAGNDRARRLAEANPAKAK